MKLRSTLFAAGALTLATAASAQAAPPFVYTANFNPASVSQFATARDMLVPLSPALLPTRGGPIGPPVLSALVADPRGRAVYALDQNYPWASQFSVQRDGRLVPMDPPTAGSGGTDMAIPADGRHAYVSTGDRLRDVFTLDIGRDGALTTSTAVGVGDGFADANKVAVSPDGRNVYVSSDGDVRTSGQTGIYQFSADADGKLTPKSPAFVPAGTYPGDMVVSPDGRSAYVIDDGQRVLQYSVRLSDGTLHPQRVPSVAAPSASGITAAPNGRSLYVTNFANDTVSRYAVGIGGGLRLVDSAPTGDGPVDIATTGRDAYVGNGSDHTVSQYRVRFDGALVPKRATPVSTSSPGGPSAVAVVGR